MAAQAPTPGESGGPGQLAVEYVTAEMLELGGNLARDGRKNKITVKHLRQAAANDGTSERE